MDSNWRRNFWSGEKCPTLTGTGPEIAVYISDMPVGGRSGVIHDSGSPANRHVAYIYRNFRAGSCERRAFFLL